MSTTKKGPRVSTKLTLATGDATLKAGEVGAVRDAILSGIDGASAYSGIAGGMANDWYGGGGGGWYGGLECYRAQ